MTKNNQLALLIELKNSTPRNRKFFHLGFAQNFASHCMLDAASSSTRPRTTGDLKVTFSRAIEPAYLYLQPLEKQKEDSYPPHFDIPHIHPICT